MARHEFLCPPIGIKKESKKTGSDIGKNKLLAAALAGAIATAAGAYYLNRETDISLSEQGKIEVVNLGGEKDPYRIFMAVDTTIVGIEESGKNILVGVTVPGEKISREKAMEPVDGGTYKIEVDSYKGTTVWFEIEKDTPILTGNYNSNVPGYGPKEALKYIKIGEEISVIDANLSYQEDIVISEGEVEENRKTLERLNSSINQSFPKSDKRFIFNASSVTVNPDKTVTK